MATNQTDAVEKLEDGQDSPESLAAATDPAARADTPAGDVDSAEEPAGRKPVRQRLADAEAEVERLTGLLDRTRQAQLERVLAEVGVEVDYAAVKGITATSHLDAESGLLNLDAVREAAEAVRQANTGARRPKPVGLAGSANTAVPPQDWAEVFKKHMTTPR